MNNATYRQILRSTVRRMKAKGYSIADRRRHTKTMLVWLDLPAENMPLITH